MSLVLLGRFEFGINTLLSSSIDFSKINTLLILLIIKLKILYTICSSHMFKRDNIMRHFMSLWCLIINFNNSDSWLGQSLSIWWLILSYFLDGICSFNILLFIINHNETWYNSHPVKTVSKHKTKKKKTPLNCVDEK